MLPSSPGELRFKEIRQHFVQRSEPTNQPNDGAMHGPFWPQEKPRIHCFLRPLASHLGYQNTQPCASCSIHQLKKKSTPSFVSDSQCDAVESSSSCLAEPNLTQKRQPKLCPSPAARGRRGGDCLPPAACIKIAKHQQMVCSTRLFLE